MPRKSPTRADIECFTVRRNLRSALAHVDGDKRGYTDRQVCPDRSRPSTDSELYEAHKYMDRLKPEK